jgi:DNA-binding GntR family transcriptional regulator
VLVVSSRSRPAGTRNTRESTTQRVKRELRDGILDGRLAPGLRLGQDALASKFGTSRLPVREALQALEAEGLVTLVQNCGARVAVLDASELAEIYRIREHLEPLAIGESTPLLSDTQIERIRELCSATEAAPDVERLLKTDREFHLACYDAAPMPRLLQMIEGFWNTSQQYRRAYASSFDATDFALMHADHRLLVDAIEHRDGVEAGMRLHAHIRRTRVRLQKRDQVFDS